MYPMSFVYNAPIWINTGNPHEQPRQGITQIIFTPKNMPPWLKNTTLHNPTPYQMPSNFQIRQHVQHPMYTQQIPGYQPPNQTFLQNQQHIMTGPPVNGQLPVANSQRYIGLTNNQVIPMRSPKSGQVNNQAILARSLNAGQVHNQPILARSPNAGQVNNQAKLKRSSNAGQVNNQPMLTRSPNVGQVNNQAIGTRSPNTGQMSNEPMLPRSPNVGQVNNQAIVTRSPNTGQENNQATFTRNPNVTETNAPVKQKGKQRVKQQNTVTTPDNGGRQLSAMTAPNVNISNKNESNSQEGLTSNINTTNNTNVDYNKCNITITPISNTAINEKITTNSSKSTLDKISVTPIELDVPKTTNHASIAMQTDTAGKVSEKMQPTEKKAYSDPTKMLSVTDQNNQTRSPNANATEPKLPPLVPLKRMSNDDQLPFPPSVYHNLSLQPLSKVDSNFKSNTVEILHEKNVPINKNNVATPTYLSASKNELTNAPNNFETGPNIDNDTVLTKKRKMESSVTEEKQLKKGRSIKEESANLVNDTVNSKSTFTDTKTSNNGTLENKKIESDKPKKVPINDKIQDILRKYLEAQSFSKSVETAITKDVTKEIDKRPVTRTRSQAKNEKDVVKNFKKTETRLDLDKKLPKINKDTIKIKPEIAVEETVIENYKIIAEVKCEEDNEIKPLEERKQAKKDEDFVVLTHVVDGYVIQESNVAFAIRKPLKEKNTRVSKRKADIKLEDKSKRSKEDFLQEADKKNIAMETDDKPFVNLKRDDVNKWTVDQLSEYLSKYNWRETMDAFRMQEVDGEALLLASKENLLKIGVEENQADIISSFIESLL